MTIGAVVDWYEDDGAVVYPIYNKNRSNKADLELLSLIFQTLSYEDVSNIASAEPKTSFNYTDLNSLNPTEDGEMFYKRIWGDN